MDVHGRRQPLPGARRRSTPARHAHHSRLLLEPHGRGVLGVEGRAGEPVRIALCRLVRDRAVRRRRDARHERVRVLRLGRRARAARAEEDRPTRRPAARRHRGYARARRARPRLQRYAAMARSERRW